MGRRLIYKPVSLETDVLFGKFIDGLELGAAYGHKCLNTLTRLGYGWSEFLPLEECGDPAVFESYYRRAGSLLALCELLGYTDGHFENVVACGEFPVLVDGETLFQNFHRGWDQVHPIARTMLLQEPVDAGPERFCYSAFQGLPEGNFNAYQTSALNDGTDKLSVE